MPTEARTAGETDCLSYISAEYSKLLEQKRTDSALLDAAKAKLTDLYHIKKNLDIIAEDVSNDEKRKSVQSEMSAKGKTLCRTEHLSSKQAEGYFCFWNGRREAIRAVTPYNRIACDVLAGLGAGSTNKQNVKSKTLTLLAAT